jgi:hypothetical protein
MTLNAECPFSVEIEHEFSFGSMHAMACNAGYRLTIPGVYNFIADRVRNSMLCRMAHRAGCDVISPEVKRII